MTRFERKKLKIFIIYLLPVINVKNGSNIALLSRSLVNLTFWKKILNCISFFANFKENSHFDLKKECKEAHYSWNLATLIAFFVNFLKELQNWKVGQVKPICIESINQSIYLSFIYSQKKKKMINKHNAIKLNKTNKTLKNNVAHNLLWEKGLQKAEKPYHKALRVQWGLSRHTKQRSL